MILKVLKIEDRPTELREIVRLVRLEAGGHPFSADSLFEVMKLHPDLFMRRRKGVYGLTAFNAPDDHPAQAGCSQGQA